MRPCIEAVKISFVCVLTFMRERIEWVVMSTLTPTQLLTEIKSLTELSEVSLAERLEISQATVNRILHGKSECKSGTLMKLQEWRKELAETERVA